MISSKETRKMKQFSNNHIHIVTYSKSDIKKLSYSEKECKKFDNIYIICKNIETILQEYQDCCVLMEGVSYGSVGSAALVDLSFLNSALRMVLKSMNIPMTIVSPTSVKKFACGNGQAEKDIMIDAWKRMDNNISGIKDIKIDDLADSYFLAHYSE
jgi:Holliday junction resolvasome RuvABC endonuclease subunit